MKASELVEILLQKIKEHGDREIVLNANGDRIYGVVYYTHQDEDACVFGIDQN
jgi:hypothetical protein